VQGCSIDRKATLVSMCLAACGIARSASRRQRTSADECPRNAMLCKAGREACSGLGGAGRPVSIMINVLLLYREQAQLWAHSNMSLLGHLPGQAASPTDWGTICLCMQDPDACRCIHCIEQQSKISSTQSPARVSAFECIHLAKPGTQIRGLRAHAALLVTSAVAGRRGAASPGLWSSRQHASPQLGGRSDRAGMHIYLAAAGAVSGRAVRGDRHSPTAVTGGRHSQQPDLSAGVQRGACQLRTARP